MNIQIFGRKKCFDTKKAERFFKERKVKYQFIDINEKPMSKGEMNNILRCIDTNVLINIKSKENEGTEVAILFPINDMMKF